MLPFFYSLPGPCGGPPRPIRAVLHGPILFLARMLRAPTVTGQAPDEGTSVAGASEGCRSGPWPACAATHQRAPAAKPHSRMLPKGSFTSSMFHMPRNISFLESLEIMFKCMDVIPYDLYSSCSMFLARHHFTMVISSSSPISSPCPARPSSRAARDSFTPYGCKWAPLRNSALYNVIQ
jgi:hypothetical protein